MYALDLSTARWRKSSRTSNANCVEVAHLESIWRKSSDSGTTNCVEVAHVDGGWRKSSRSTDNANCVEVGFAGAGVAVRDSKNTVGPVLAFPKAGWMDFLSAVDG